MTVLVGDRIRIDPDDPPERVAVVTRAWLAEHLPADWTRAR